MKVSIHIRIKTAAGWRYCEPVMAENHRLKPQYALVDGNEEKHTEGVYFLRYVSSGKRTWERVGTDAAAAVTMKKKRELAAIDPTAVAPDATTEGMNVQAAATEYLAEVKVAKSERTYLAYALAVNAFVEVCKAPTVQSISRKDILEYTASLKDQELSKRTQANRLVYLKTFLLHFGVKWPMKATDRIRYTEKTVSAYNTEELRKLFAAADQEETELFTFFWQTGMREQEVMFSSWRDVDFVSCRVRVSEKTDLGFTPKDKEEGWVPVPESLIALLKARRERYPNSRLIFPREDGQAEGHFLRKLKALAARAGFTDLDGNFGLHKFRKTFATTHHRNGVSARQIQKWLRHSSLDTTLRYLAGEEDEQTLAKVNSAFMALPGPVLVKVA